MKALLIIIIGLLVANITITVFNHNDITKTAYVRSQDLVYKFHGMIEAQSQFKEKMSGIEANRDTLQSIYQKALSEYNLKFDQLSIEEKNIAENDLRNHQQNILSYHEAMELKANEEEELMLEGVLNQVNSFVETYAEEKGIDLILGTTLSGSLLYGEEAIDITEDILVELNENYDNGTVQFD